MSCYMTYVQNMLYNMCHVMLYNMSCYVKSYNIHHVMLYSICSEYVIQQNRTCYMTYVIIYITCVMLYNICS